MTAPTGHRTRDVMRRVNDLISESLATGARSEPVAFFCECADAGCYQPVWLSPAEYQQARRDPRWTALAEAHSAATASHA